MTARRLLTAALLLFVAASVITLLAKERRGHPPPGRRFAGVTEGRPADARQVIAYYFLGNVRCSSCRKIEEVSRRTIERSFPRELADGRLRFLVVNVDRPENRHFIEEFRLESSSLVLVDMQGGNATGWKSLPDVWTLVDDAPRLEEYVRDEVLARIKGS